MKMRRVPDCDDERQPQKRQRGRRHVGAKEERHAFGEQEHFIRQANEPGARQERNDADREY